MTHTKYRTSNKRSNRRRRNRKLPRFRNGDADHMRRTLAVLTHNLKANVNSVHRSNLQRSTRYDRQGHARR